MPINEDLEAVQTISKDLWMGNHMEKLKISVKIHQNKLKTWRVNNVAN